MVSYLQTDPRWANLTFSSAKLSIKKYGCFIVSLATLTQTEPPTVAFKLRQAEAFTSEGYLISEKVANALELDFGGKTTDLEIAKKWSEWVICETDHYKKSGYNQHFYCFNTITGEQYDPLGSSVIYQPKTYRLFKVKRKEYMTKEQAINMVYGIIEPMWRRMHNNEEVGEAGVINLGKEANEMVENASQGKEWVGAGKAEQWYNEELAGQIKELQDDKILLGKKDTTIAELQKENINLNKLYESEKVNIKVAEKEVVKIIKVNTPISEVPAVEIIKELIRRLKWKK